MFEYDGYVRESVAAIIMLIVGVAVSVLVITFAGALGGQTYNLVEDDIDAISNANIQASVRDSIESGFEALETTGDYMPIIVLAVMVSIVLALLINNLGGGIGMGYGRGGYAL